MQYVTGIQRCLLSKYLTSCCSFVAEDSTYICTDCDAKRLAAKTDGVNPRHKLSHPLVQLFDNEPVPEPQDMDVSPMAMITRLSEMDTKIAALDKKLDEFMSLATSLREFLRGKAEDELIQEDGMEQD
jgi:hypothetical protein